MRPELFSIFGLPIHGYGVMVLIGASCGLWLLSREARRQGWDATRCVDLSVAVVVCGLVGARIFYYVQFYEEQFAEQSWVAILKVWEGGLVLYGGIIAGVLTMLVLLKRNKIPVFRFLDAAAPSLAIGIAFGRIGCFLNGCCWGRVCSPDFPFAVRFPTGSPAVTHAQMRFGEGFDPASYFVEPTQLYSSANGFVLAGILWLVQRLNPPTGVVAGYLFLHYGVARFLIEGIRGDHDVAQGALTVSQKISIAMVGIGLALILGALGRRRSSRLGGPEAASS